MDLGLKDAAVRRKKVVLLGSTGSIGCSTLEVARLLPERVELIGLAANGSVEALAKQVHATGVKHVALHDASRVDELRALLPAGVTIYPGPEGLVELATLAEAEMVLVAIVGTAGLHPALAAIEAGKDLAVASKEILVMAGEVVTASTVIAAARRKSRDSF
jgi:1-deoxy-D-xylulose-5-phosphate reductoisomerase